jgi:hypothetical protein
LPLLTLPGGLPVEVPVDLSRSEARQAARDELRKQIYQQAEPSIAERAVRWLLELLSTLFDDAGRVSPGGQVGLIGLLVLIVAGVVAFRLKLGPLARSAAQADALFVGAPRSSADYRSAADAHAAASRWAEAVRDRLRAIIRGLEERDLLEPRPGRTADEAARDAGLVLPDCAQPLLVAAREFDEIWYGGRAARRAVDEQLRQLDARVQAARPRAAARSDLSARVSPPQ